MPSYAALFDGAPDRPSQEAQDLVAYIDTLGTARELAWPEADEAAARATLDDKWAQMSFAAPVLNAHPARTRPRGNAPAIVSSRVSGSRATVVDGQLFGLPWQRGHGDGPGAQWLSHADEPDRS